MSLHEPPLYEAHLAADADFTDFGGWRMPVEFDGIRQEHSAVRDSVGIFDVSHMGEISVGGPDAAHLMNRLTTNEIRDLDPGDAQYSTILTEEGVIIDDTVVYRYPERDGFLFVPNAGHEEQIYERWSKYATEFGLSVTIEDRTHHTGLVAVQGPDAAETVDATAVDQIDDIDRFTCVRTEIDTVSCLVARTGYTGEDGYEIFFDAADSMAVWNTFDEIQPCGLGARDTLRLEAGLLLSGRDFDPVDEPRTPLEAGLEFVVDFSKSEFVGKSALAVRSSEDIDETIVGMKLDGRAIARHGYPIVDGGTQIGHVTSGTISPTFNTPLALGYVDTTVADLGTQVGVQIRDRTVDATIVDQCFLNSMNGK